MPSGLVQQGNITARCCLSSLLAYEQGATYLENEDSTYFQPVTDTVRYDNWTLVFRVLAGSGQETYATWTRTGLHHDHWLGSKDMKLGCVSMNASKPCNTLFRSRLLDDWQKLKVKKAIYDGCDKDSGWLVVVDSTKYACSWERHPPPAILYSGTQGSTAWQSNNVVVADVFAVFIQY
ncbi:hypothetical protein C0Q70_15774 [Pomacea canaliculata]|uniref:Uncharacterized protein n=1 Tax=Pomacea canaliculata TaxID=400727 RepID=A0A2T7NVU4_POMCA|nr:hypothetical protein C0Q70_15774 [Pomacea canaliculata]